MKGKRVRVAIAPIAWTNDDLPELGGGNTFEQCISEMALAGYEGSEVGNKYPKDPAVLKHFLDVRGLTICNAWFSSFLTTRPYPEVETAFLQHRDFLFEVGARVIGAAEQGHSIQGMQDVPIFEGKPRFTDAEWKLLAEGHGHPDCRRDRPAHGDDEPPTPGIVVRHRTSRILG
jgi:inosose dehydratase